MTYAEALEYIGKNSQNQIIPGLDNMRALCALLGHPEKKMRVIHIAGTNGKGSVGAFIEAGLINSGFSVGRYSSPAVLDYRDRLTYNGEWISREEYAGVIEYISQKIENSGIKPTVFELETAAAFCWLFSKNCDYVIIEAGMGGKLDATNVTDKVLSVITPIALDHTAFLGNTIEEIAEQKAGIITGRAVSAQQPKEAQSILKAHSSDIVFVDNGDIKNVKYGAEKTVFDYKSHKGVEINLLGAYQTENAALAIEALESLGIRNISLKNARWSCRFRILRQKPLIIADGAHNPQGIDALKKSLALYFGGREFVFITGVLKDKNYEYFAREMAPLAKMLITVETDNKRSLGAEEYADVIRKYNKNVKIAGTVKKALEMCGGFENILVFGTLTIMSELYSALGEDICADITT